MSHMRRVVFLVISILQLLAKDSFNILSNLLHEKLYKKFTDNNMFTFMAQVKRDQKIMIFSHSLALTLFQSKGPLGVLLMGGTYQFDM